MNGQKIGNTGDSHAASIYDVKSLLHAGENTVAVTISNWGVTAGLTRGAMLRLAENPAPVQWQRSVFNGYAQIIVQASKTAGPLKLTAQAPGLKAATFTVQANPAAPRPVVP